MPGSAPPLIRRSERPPQREGGASSLLGTTVGDRYRIDSILGEGGMGTVYAAEHTLMRKRVAIKVLHPAMSRLPDMVARFEREAMAAGHIDHPNVAAATDFGQLADGSFFLVLEMVTGKSLRQSLADGPIPVSRSIHIGCQIASALTRAHSLGVVHRDLKPDNVMLVTRDGDADFVKVLDFGIAKVPVLDIAAPPPPSSDGTSPPPGAQRVLTQMGMIYGTPEYMAPEQALGQPIDGRADLYALGVVLFEMLTGRRPFDHESTAMLLGMHVTAPVPAMADVAPDHPVPTAVEAVIRRLLAKDAAQRFATAAELEEALNQASLVTLPTQVAPTDVALAAVPAGAASSTSPTPPPTWTARRFGVIAGLGLVVVVAAGWLASRLAAGPHPASTRSATSQPSAVPSSVAAPVASSAAPAPPPPAPPPEDPLAATIAAADASLTRDDPDSAIRAVAPLEAGNGGRPDVHRILERAYAKKHDRAAALREADAWLALDPSATADLALQADVGEIATHPALSDAAISLLASRMGTPGVDILYDLAYASHQASPVTRRARTALAQPEVRAHAGPAAAILLDLRDATTCEAKRALLPRAKTDGDRRALALLQPLSSGRGIGSCLRGDTDLADAIAAVRARTRML
jgi:serine/threonine-protein kinase